MAVMQDSPIIEAQNIGLTLAKRSVLEDVSLTLSKGEIVTLLGPNGSGKTSLLRVLLGLQKPTTGKVRRAKKYRFGYMPQTLNLTEFLPLVVSDLFKYSGRFSKEDMLESLALTQASHLISEPISRLSGGQRQRVLLARVLYINPDLLFLDEPLQGVDYLGEQELYKLIAKTRDERGVGVFLVSHDLHLVMAHSDRAICLNRHICCSGKVEQIEGHPAFQELLTGVPLATSAHVKGEDSMLGFYRHHHDHQHDCEESPDQKRLDQTVDGKQGMHKSDSQNEGTHQ